MKWARNGFRISDDINDLDVTVIHALLRDTYWASDRSRETVERSLSQSLNFGLFDNQERQIGFLRVVTDYVTFAWICDVVVHPDYRGQGLGKWLVACMLEHPGLKSTNKILGTRDAHGLYEQYGFTRSEVLRRPKDLPA